MKGLILTEQELIELRAAHKKATRHDASSAYKINAIILLGTGWTFVRVKEALLLDEDTLSQYVSRYQEGGVERLIKTEYKGKQGMLSAEGIEMSEKELDSRIYLTTLAIIDYVKREFNVIYSISGMCELLHRIGYEYKKPKAVPGNPDHEAQDIFADRQGKKN